MNKIKDILKLFWQMIENLFDEPILAVLCWGIVIWLVYVGIF